MVGQVKSISGKSIRLPDERWAHITEEHSEMSGYRTEVLETVNQPESVFQGGAGECLAVRECENGKFFVVVYREGERGGFIITALERRQRLWP